MEEFIKQIQNRYTLEDITGHLGALFDDNADEEELNTSYNFVRELYYIASKCVKWGNYEQCR